MFTLLVAHSNLKAPDTITQDKLAKIFDLFLPKMPAVTILYTNEEFDAIKALDPNFVAMEDFIKTPDEDQFVFFYD
jgi:hypothetical protein